MLEVRVGGGVLEGYNCDGEWHIMHSNKDTTLY